MTQSNICIRMDKKLKEQFVHLCDELGLTMSTAINIFARAVVRTGSIPFALSIDDYNEETRKAIEDVENGIGLSKAYTDIDEMFRDMELEDDEDEEVA